MGRVMGAEDAPRISSEFLMTRYSDMHPPQTNDRRPEDEGRQKQSARRVLWASIIALFAVVMPAHFYLLFKIPKTPTTPDSHLGFVFPTNNNGVIHYIGQFDHTLGIVVPVAFISLFAIIIVAYFRSRTKSPE
jgi:hypothetical protein